MSISTLKKHFYNSYTFAKIFLINLCGLTFVFLFGFFRFITGITRHKPILLISITLVVLLIIIIIICNKVIRMFFSITIPQLYKNEIVPNINVINNWEWQYFLNSPALVAPSLFLWAFPTGNSSSGGDGGSCGGGSCGGGGCGGGGCGGGCGGCGGG